MTLAELRLRKECPTWLKANDIEVSNEDIVIDHHNRVCWNKGIWKRGTWEDGFWKNGTWEDGTWKDGTWEKGMWLNGTWEKGWWSKGIWVDGLWKNGNWGRGTWVDGLWLSGKWYNGTWLSGWWESGVWEDGLWKSGTWDSGTWEKGICVDMMKLHLVLDNNGIYTSSCEIMIGTYKDDGFYTNTWTMSEVKSMLDGDSEDKAELLEEFTNHTTLEKVLRGLIKLNELDSKQIKPKKSNQ